VVSKWFKNSHLNSFVWFTIQLIKLTWSHDYLHAHNATCYVTLLGWASSISSRYMLSNAAVDFLLPTISNEILLFSWIARCDTPSKNIKDVLVLHCLHKPMCTAVWIVAKMCRYLHQKVRILVTIFSYNNIKFQIRFWICITLLCHMTVHFFEFF